MQDKDIDQLFRSKLADFEVEPSERVWKGITVEIGGAKSKRTLMPVIRIAAAVVLVSAFGLYFLVKDNKQDQYQAANHTNVHRGVKTDEENGLKNVLPQPTEQVAPEIQTQETTVAKAAEDSKSASIAYSVPVKTKSLTHAIKETKVKVQQPKTTVDQQRDDTPDQSDQQLAAVTQPAEPVKQATAVVPDEPLAPAKPEVNTADDFATSKKNVQVAQVNETKTAKQTKRHGIRSFGDLINVVVAKVDKRQDKLIEFTNTDDDEATITGVNLGLVKVKKEK
ncbi:hypothetical protein MUY27_06930 [Mucilaginibacter sp. RS28]|uniref:Uncharacterized protein n=2 Tax=Mucilaginibacter straminoryzae TaxID=2932774 RepID=A0A9X1X1C4_9SPHI|nr:hypothetical protein [Mucilaginibacter straminoryzae]